MPKSIGKWFYIGIEKSKPTTCSGTSCDDYELIWADGSRFVYNGVALTASSLDSRGFRTRDAAAISDITATTALSVLCSANCHASK